MKAAQNGFQSSARIQVLPFGTNQVMIVETGLHLNPKHPSYNRSAVETLISAAQDYVSANVDGPVLMEVGEYRSLLASHEQPRTITNLVPL